MKKSIVVLMMLIGIQGLATGEPVVVVPMMGDTYMVEPADVVDAHVIVSETNFSIAYTVPDKKIFRAHRYSRNR